MIIRSGVLTDLSAVITDLKRTDDLNAGLFLYGDNIPVETKILSVDEDDVTQITMTKNATGSGIVSINFSPASVGVYHETNCALMDAQNEINERGEQLKFILRGEGDLKRDRYNSIKAKNQKPKYFLKAFPITIDPSSRELEKAGLREEVDALVYTSMKEWSDQSVDFIDIEPEKMSVILRGETYEVREKGMVSQFSDTFLYLTFGLFKK